MPHLYYSTGTTTCIQHNIIQDVEVGRAVQRGNLSEYEHICKRSYSQIQLYLLQPYFNENVKYIRTAYAPLAAAVTILCILPD